MGVLLPAPVLTSLGRGRAPWGCIDAHGLRAATDDARSVCILAELVLHC